HGPRFHHQPEAQHPKSSAIHKLAGRLPHLSPQQRREGGHRGRSEQCQTRKSVIISNPTYLARLYTLSFLPPAPGDRATHFSSSPDTVKGRFDSSPSWFGNMLVSRVMMSVLLASSTDQLPKIATVACTTARLSSAVPSRRLLTLNLGRSGRTCNCAYRPLG